MTTTTAPTTSPTERRGAFFGEGALPADPVARDHEKRGRRWLMFSYLFCPCHIPITLALLGAAFGSTTIGAALTGDTLRVGIALTTIYALVLWRGFRQIRRAKQIEAAGGTLTCSRSGCDLTTPPASAPQRSTTPPRTSADCRTPPDPPRPALTNFFDHRSRDHAHRPQ